MNLAKPTIATPLTAIAVLASEGRELVVVLRARGTSGTRASSWRTVLATHGGPHDRAALQRALA